MNAVIDIGNTRTKLGLFYQNTLIESAIWSTCSLEQITDWATRHQVQRILVSSVAEPDPALLPGLQAQFETTALTPQTPLPFVNLYQTPHTLGKDRLAGVAGAQALFPAQHCMIVDCGTCIKYELLSADGQYRGGNIAPGLAMRVRAMHEFTARLPDVAIAMPENPIGNSTETALQNGAVRGTVLEITGFARLFSEQADNATLQVILTGGDAFFLMQYLTIHHLSHEPHLTLIGLNAILNC